MIRWASLGSPLPPSWTPDSLVRITAPILDLPEFTDSKTIIRTGIWDIQLLGYAGIIPGDTMAFTGKVETKVLGNKFVKLIMKDPTFEKIAIDEGVGDCLICRMRITISIMRQNLLSILEKNLPEPMSSLAAGIILGINRGMPRDFYDALVSTGTIHVVAASGYNVAIVAKVVMGALGRLLGRKVSVVFGVVGIVIYIMLAGMSASVVRAGVMGSLALIAVYFGRPTEARRLLWVTVMILLLFYPLMLVDVGFQLSVAATIGILYIQPLFDQWGQRILSRIGWLQATLSDYLYPTLAASISTLPVILWYFGRMSWMSPIVNMLILPVVPLIMFLTSISLFAGSVNLVMGRVVSVILYVPLAWVVWVVELFGQ